MNQHLSSPELFTWSKHAKQRASERFNASGTEFEKWARKLLGNASKVQDTGGGKSLYRSGQIDIVLSESQSEIVTVYPASIQLKRIINSEELIDFIKKDLGEFTKQSWNELGKELDGSMMDLSFLFMQFKTERTPQSLDAVINELDEIREKIVTYTDRIAVANRLID